MDSPAAKMTAGEWGLAVSLAIEVAAVADAAQLL